MNTYLKNLCIFAFSGTVTVMEILRGASLLFVVLGGVFAAMGGYYAFRVKKLEFEEKTYDHSLKYKYDIPPDANGPRDK